MNRHWFKYDTTFEKIFELLDLYQIDGERAGVVVDFVRRQSECFGRHGQ
jgi:hypothetical protein